MENFGAYHMKNFLNFWKPPYFSSLPFPKWSYCQKSKNMRFFWHIVCILGCLKKGGWLGWWPEMTSLLLLLYPPKTVSVSCMVKNQKKIFHHITKKLWRVQGVFLKWILLLIIKSLDLSLTNIISYILKQTRSCVW